MPGGASERHQEGPEPHRQQDAGLDPARRPTAVPRVHEAPPRCIWTVGSSNRTLAEFLDVLRAYAIKTVVDVRTYPASTRFPHFSRDRLARALRRAGILYVHLGADLGGIREGGFEAYMAGPAFQTGLRTLEFTAGREPTAVMCAERLPWQCHRRFIAQALARRGWQVVHVIEVDQTWAPGDAESPELPLGEPPSHE
jgi:hypothetical protein